jgi:hypothetical protein
MVMHRIMVTLVMISLIDLMHQMVFLFLKVLHSSSTVFTIYSQEYSTVQYSYAYTSFLRLISSPELTLPYLQYSPIFLTFHFQSLVH